MGGGGCTRACVCKCLCGSIYILQILHVWWVAPLLALLWNLCIAIYVMWLLFFLQPSHWQLHKVFCICENVCVWGICLCSVVTNRTESKCIWETQNLFYICDTKSLCCPPPNMRTLKYIDGVTERILLSRHNYILALFIDILSPSTCKSKQWLVNAKLHWPWGPKFFLSFDYKMESKKTKVYFHVCIY